MSRIDHSNSLHISSASLFNGVALKICKVEPYDTVYFSLQYDVKYQYQSSKFRRKTVLPLQ